MGCAIHYDNIGFKVGSYQEKFNGVMLRFARQFEGLSLECLAKQLGIRHDHLLEIEECLCQPSQYEVHRIMEIITAFTDGFYHFETYTKENPDAVFVCGKGIQPCANCGQLADFLCDYPIGGAKTCDLPICHQCRIHIGKYDFCPIHSEANKAIQRL